MITDAQKAAIWDLLVDLCGANESQRGEFMYHFPRCVEFRFQGIYGFGGKVFAATHLAGERRVYVTCYREDETPALLVTITRVNEALKALISN